MKFLADMGIFCTFKRSFWGREGLVILRKLSSDRRTLRVRHFRRIRRDLSAPLKMTSLQKGLLETALPSNSGVA